jgi:hypothetical protein
MQAAGIDADEFVGRAWCKGDLTLAHMCAVPLGRCSRLVSSRSTASRTKSVLPSRSPSTAAMRLKVPAGNGAHSQREPRQGGAESLGRTILIYWQERPNYDRHSRGPRCAEVKKKARVVRPGLVHRKKRPEGLDAPTIIPKRETGNQKD